MSYSNDIRKLLDIQDSNITFGENFIQEGQYKGKSCKYITAKLTYHPTHCEKCNIENKNFTVYKNGTQLSRITLPITGVHPTYLCLKKQRFFCTTCKNRFTAKISIVKTHCFISKNVKLKIILKAAEAQSLTSIAKDCSVSAPTIQREINQAAKQFKPHDQVLPKHLSFDEFKYAKGAMAFEYINVVTGDILDILDRRDSLTIKNHFIANYSLSHRKHVETVTST